MTPDEIHLGLEDDWEEHVEQLGGEEEAAAAAAEFRRGYDPALADKVLSMEEKVGGRGPLDIPVGYSVRCSW